MLAGIPGIQHHAGRLDHQPAALWHRITRIDHQIDHYLLDLVGIDADAAKVSRFGQEIAPLITAGPPGVTGFAGGRPKATEVLGYWPSLIPKDRVHPQVVVEEVP